MLAKIYPFPGGLLHIGNYSFSAERCFFLKVFTINFHWNKVTWVDKVLPFAKLLLIIV